MATEFDIFILNGSTEEDRLPWIPRVKDYSEYAMGVLRALFLEPTYSKHISSWACMA